MLPSKTRVPGGLLMPEVNQSRFQPQVGSRHQDGRPFHFSSGIRKTGFGRFLAFPRSRRCRLSAKTRSPRTTNTWRIICHCLSTLCVVRLAWKCGSWSIMFRLRNWSLPGTAAAARSTACAAKPEPQRDVGTVLGRVRRPRG